MTHNTEVIWKKGMYFEANLQGHSIKIDADKQFGGENNGPTPKPLLLVALGGCTSMDVVSILNKMKVKYTDFSVSVSAEQTDEHPKVYKEIKIIYQINGENIPFSKIEKAVKLSMEEYCGVYAMLSKVCPIKYEIKGLGIDYNL